MSEREKTGQEKTEEQVRLDGQCCCKRANVNVGVPSDRNEEEGVKKIGHRFLFFPSPFMLCDPPTESQQLFLASAERCTCSGFLFVRREQVLVKK